MPIPYRETVYERDGFQVILSNEGSRTKTAPHRLRFPNPEKRKVTCGEDGCAKKTTSQTGLCGDHRKEKYADHPVDWIAKLILPGRDVEDTSGDLMTHLDVTGHIIDWAKDDEDRLRTLDSFVLSRVESDIPGKVPDATFLQDELEKGKSGVAPTVESFVNRANSGVDATFVSDGWESSKVTVRLRNHDEPVDLPVTVAAHHYYMALLCEEANRGDAWYVNNVEPEHSLKVEIQRAGSYMPLAFYLLLRFTDAPVAAAQQAIQSGYM